MRTCLCHWCRPLLRPPGAPERLVPRCGARDVPGSAQTEHRCCAVRTADRSDGADRISLPVRRASINAALPSAVLAREA